MGCCQSGHTVEKEILGSQKDASKIQEIQGQSQLSMHQQQHLNSKIDSSSVNNNNMKVSNNQQSNLPNSKKITGSAVVGQDKMLSTNHNVETQPDGKGDDKVHTQVSQDINHDDSDRDDNDSDQEDQVNDIIDNLIKQNITSMNN